MNEIMGYLISIVAIFGISVFTAMTRKGFSMDIFLCSVVIAISVLIWKNVLPFSTITLCALLVIGLLFSHGGNTGDESDE